MLALVIDQRRRDLGGFEVGRVLPVAARRMVGPFIFLDHMGPADFPAGISKNVDVRPHPHIGLSTVTYLFEGEIMHRDSVGSEQPIRPAEVNWMIAGRGITHSERFEKARAQGDRLHGIQAWVALPQEQEERAPAFGHYAGSDLPVSREKGFVSRLIAGEIFGQSAKAQTHSPMVYAHWGLQAATKASVPAHFSERALYVAQGTIAHQGRCYRAGQMLVFSGNDADDIVAETAATLLLIGGEPVGPRFIEWNFVSSSKDRIAQAKADWRAGRMALPPSDSQEFTPLPD